jgi:hypothetical protein
MLVFNPWHAIVNIVTIWCFQQYIIYIYIEKSNTSLLQFGSSYQVSTYRKSTTYQTTLSINIGYCW